LNLNQNNTQEQNPKENKMNNQYPQYPELTETGKKQAQELMIKFEKELKESAIKIMQNITNEFYYDIVNEIESDQWSNYRSKILDYLKGYKSGHCEYDFNTIRRAIYMNHKDEIVKDLNQDLLKKNDELRRIAYGPNAIIPKNL
jgi:hypothetical protein